LRTTIIVNHTYWWCSWARIINVQYRIVIIIIIFIQIIASIIICILSGRCYANNPTRAVIDIIEMSVIVIVIIFFSIMATITIYVD